MFQNTLSRRRLMAISAASAAGVALGATTTIRKAGAQLASQYELIDLGVTDNIGDTTLGFNDMNAAGVIVGNMDIDGTKNSPFVFKDGELTRIKTGEFGARASCINNGGVIGGRDLKGWHTEEQPWGLPALWIDGEKEVLPFPDGLPSPGEEGRVYDLNDNGIAVGDVSIAGGVTVPVMWENGVAQILDGYVEGGRGTAFGINNLGIILGDLIQGDSSGELSGGVTWTFGFVEYITLSTEGAAGFGFTSIDEQGRILGYLDYGDGMAYAAYHTGNGSVPTVLGPSVENEVQSGLYCSLGDSLFGGVVWDGSRNQAYVWDNGFPIEVRSLVKNTRGLRLANVIRFSDDGWIGGNAVDGDGATHPYLLIPA